MGYCRKDYTDKLFDYTGSKLVKVLVGQRRTGKSYILRQIAYKLIEGGVDPRNIFYVNKEFTDFDFISDYKDLEVLLKLYHNYANKHSYRQIVKQYGNRCNQNHSQHILLGHTVKGS